jgi:hypothetical protein
MGSGSFAFGASRMIERPINRQRCPVWVTLHFKPGLVQLTARPNDRERRYADGYGAHRS